MEAFIGDYVRTKYFGHTGRVYNKHINFKATGSSDTWFNLQRLDVHTKDETWYDVLVKNGGAICVPQSHIDKKIPEFKLNNNFEQFYFGDK